MLHKITGNTEDNRAIKIETNKGKVNKQSNKRKCRGREEQRQQ